MIDKYTHLLDMERAVYDTIMLDNAVRLARDWAQARGDDTLILVLADHNHPISLVGTIDDDMSQRPTCRCASASGSMKRPAFPTIRPRMRKAIRRGSMSAGGLRSFPRACRTTTRPSARSSTIRTSRPLRASEAGTFEANDKLQGCPGRRAALRQSSGDDQRQRAFGRGRDPHRHRARQRTRARSMDNTEVFRVMADALGLAAAGQ